MTVVSFLASGRGSNFQTVASAILNGHIQAETGILITTKKKCGALEIADKLGIKSLPLSWKEENGREGFERKALAALNEVKTDLVVCAGYMKILSPGFIRNFPNKIINIHPALLPAFPGLDAQKQAIDYGAKISGCTAHFIDEGVDTGPIIIQHAVNIEPTDDAETLSARILPLEHKILTEAVRLFCLGKLKVQQRRVSIY